MMSIVVGDVRCKKETKDTQVLYTINRMILLIKHFSAILAFSIRLFSVLRYESMIHEFDPYFNYRTTRFLSEEGFYAFHNWFDDRAWYPLGRIIGGTIYPGLMVTSAVFTYILNLGTVLCKYDIQKMLSLTRSLFYRGLAIRDKK